MQRLFLRQTKGYGGFFYCLTRQPGTAGLCRRPTIMVIFFQKKYTGQCVITKIIVRLCTNLFVTAFIYETDKTYRERIGNPQYHLG